MVDLQYYTDGYVAVSLNGAATAGFEPGSPAYRLGALMVFGGLADNSGLVGAVENCCYTESESTIEDAVASARYFGREDAARTIEAAHRFWIEHYQGRDIDEEESERLEPEWNRHDDNWFALGLDDDFFSEILAKGVETDLTE